MKISIEAARVNAGLTLRDAAKELGVSASTLSGYENGKVPRFDIIQKMAVLYNWPIENLRVGKE
jgi:transcriptional regulator with XRE-family HTH domain